MNCPFCKKQFNPYTGRRAKRFCSNPCKVSFWNMQKSKERKGELAAKEKADRNNKLISTARGRDENGVNNDEVKIIAPKLKFYDYSAMPSGLLYPAREAWKKKARAEQDKN